MVEIVELSVSVSDTVCVASRFGSKSSQLSSRAERERERDREKDQETYTLIVSPSGTIASTTLSSSFSTP